MLAASFFAMSSQAIADEGTSDIWAIARGGQLYDNWMEVMEREAPEQTHPAYPADAKKSGATTWRCKECHGWDYMGKDGAYASGKHASGIVGIQGAAGTKPEMIVAVLKDASHGYGDLLSEEDLVHLANFVSQGQVNMDEYIDRESKQTGGDAEQGAAYYNTLCVNCHGLDGKLPEDMKPLGALMGNPWEVMHKILNGQPAENMPGLRALDPQITQDIMAYLVSLPTE
jgi:thiosulfate dehydrogenase